MIVLKDKYKMEPGIIIFLAILLLLLLVYLFQSPCTKEGFTDSDEYNKYENTYVKADGKTGSPDLNTEKLYQDYQGPIKGMSQWTNVNLDQCKKNCDELGSNCVGFVRPNSDGDDNELGTCSPRTSLTHCRNPRRGNNTERNNSLQYDTYIKSSVANQMNTCVGSEITLNRIISIQPVREPYKYVIASKFNIIVKAKPSKNVAQFIENSKFKIVAGLEGSGTISFKLLRHAADKEYYIGHNIEPNNLTNRNIEVVGINPSTATSEDKRKVSFKLENGLADNYSNKLSLRLLNPQGDNTKLYLYLNNRSIFVYQRTDSSRDQEATFDIVDPINNRSVVNNTDNFKNIEGMVATKSSDFKRKIKPEDRLKINNSLNNNIAHFENTQTHNDQMSEMEKAAFGEDTSHNLQEQRVLQLQRLIDNNNEMKQQISNEINNVNQKIRNVDVYVNSLSAQDLAQDYFFLKSLEKAGLYGSSLSD